LKWRGRADGTGTDPAPGGSLAATSLGYDPADTGSTSAISRIVGAQQAWTAGYTGAGVTASAGGCTTCPNSSAYSDTTKYVGMAPGARISDVKVGAANGATWSGVRWTPWPLADRTVLLSLGLVAAALALLHPALASRPVDHGTALTWWELSGVFALAEVLVFHVEVSSEAYTFSLSEVPLVLGLLFVQPRELIAARLVGEAVVLILIERQTLTKLVFNLSLFALESTSAPALFHPIAAPVPDPLSPRTWLAAGIAVAAADLIGHATVWLVIRLHGGRVDLTQLLVAAAITVSGNTSIAAVAAVLIHVDPVAVVPLLVVAAILVTAYRGYTRLTKRYAGLEMLYQFTRITSDHASPDETLRRVLAEAGRLLRTHRAAVALYRPGEDGPWMIMTTTSTGDGGSVVAQDGFGEPDLPEQLREDVLRNGRLVLVPRTSSQPGHRQLLAALNATDCIAAPLSSGGRVSGVLLVCDRLGEVSTFDAEDGRLFATLANQAAIALENGRLIERLREQVAAREHEAMHDALTGLPNRTLFAQRLDEALQGDPRHGQVAVLLMDLDGFKEVNDTLGHHVGDQLLTEVARRLREAIGDNGTVARLGGDEFALLLPGLPGVDAGLAKASEINQSLWEPVRLASLALEVHASTGVAVWPDHGADTAGLLQRADVAMYAAKRDRCGVMLYDPQTDWNSELRLRLAGELRHAIESHQIDVWYQPIARAVDGQVVAAEALVRWHHPELGRIGPDDFIPIAERTGLIHDLTRYVLDHALAQARAWRAAGLELGVAVNLSTHVLRDVDWPAKVAELLHVHGAAPHWLTFEITETGLMADPEHMTTMLHGLAANGITFAIDDFGTGYSSLAYLQQLPVSKVKIDKSFVIPMAGDPAAAAIVRSVIDLARSLDLTVVAEGVEDQRTLDHLVSMQCHLVQGYYLSKPIPAIELTEWISRREAARRERPVLRILSGRGGT
jgi:diguanylate cyclase (GGDEF)-like protein